MNFWILLIKNFQIFYISVILDLYGQYIFIFNSDQFIIEAYQAFIIRFFFFKRTNGIIWHENYYLTFNIILFLISRTKFYKIKFLLARKIRLIFFWLVSYFFKWINCFPLFFLIAIFIIYEPIVVIIIKLQVIIIE